jgi:hypothetical protein
VSTWAVVFLGLVALGSVVQSAFLVYLAMAGLRLSRRVADMQGEITREIQPALADLARVQQNLGEASERLALQTERVEQMVADVTERIDEARDAVMPIASRVMTVVAAVNGIRRGLRLIRGLRGSGN